MPQFHFRSIWISDIHLGTRNLQNQQLLDFLQQTEAEYLYLVGDIIDIEQMRKSWHWPKINDQIVHNVIEKANNGTKVIYIPGNHDHQLRKFHGSVFNNITIMNSVIHETLDGSRYLILHGDKFDPVVQCSPWLASLGSTAYEMLLMMNRVVNRQRRAVGKDYKSISAYLKHQVKLAVNYMANFEEVVVREAVDQQVDGLICGHIHRAGIRMIDSVLYNNAGDWVESCTALAENWQGQLGIVEWRQAGSVTEGCTVKEYENLYSDRCLASAN